MSHSKRNTSLAFFTTHERTLLRNTWGSQSTRLTRDSFLPFASCRLCLLPARDPVACPGCRPPLDQDENPNTPAKKRIRVDLFCRECALNDLVAQRQEIKRMEREWEAGQLEKADEEERAREAERRQSVEEFERVSQGLEADESGRKRKREAEDGDAAKKRKAPEDRKGEASFWIPGVSAEHANGTATKPEKLNPLCPASTPATKHGYGWKTLVNVLFTEEKGEKTGDVSRVCPSCRKALSNSSKAMLARPCGHVMCGSCVELFMIPKKQGVYESRGRVQCYICEADVREGAVDEGKKGGGGEKGREKIRPGLVEISCEGTGFAGGGTNMAKREGVAFQC